MLITNRDMINMTQTNHHNTVQYREEQTEVLQSNRIIIPKISLSKRAVRIRSIEKIIIRKEVNREITFRRKKQKNLLMLNLVQELRIKLFNCKVNPIR